jgi:drug/metabolite transporter (DMT)-like permease
MSKPVIVWLLLCVIWGSTWIFIKMGLQDLPPFTFAGIRSIIAASILTLIAFIRGLKFPTQASDWKLLALTGLLTFSINYGLLFWGEQYTSSGLAAVLQATIPVFGLIVAHYYLPGERITLLKSMGVMLGIFGLAVIFSNQIKVEGTMGLWGSIAIVLGAFSVAYSNVLIKSKGSHLEPTVLAACQMLFGLIPLMFGFFLEGSPFHFRWSNIAIISLLYLAIVGSTIAFLLFYWLVRNIDVTVTMLIALATPLMAVVLGMVVLDERLTWRIVVGGTCIMGGIGLIIFKRR